MQAVDTINKHGLPGVAESYWIASSGRTAFPTPPAGFSVDVAIVGGGFVGIATAWMLQEAGLRVAVLEARQIVQGVTGYTTAKITSLHRLIYKHLLDSAGREKAAQYAEANQKAIDKIEELVNKKNIPCSFSRLPFFTFAESDKFARKIEEEIKAAQSLGLPADFVNSIPLPVPIRGAIRFDNQAQFHPRHFLTALADLASRKGVYIFEKTRVVDIEDGEPCTLTTTRGSIRANNVVVATNFPIQDKAGAYFARLQVMRSYVLGIRMPGHFPEGMFINAEENGHSFRAQPTEDGQMVIIGGEDHITGHEPDTLKRYQGMSAFVNRTFSGAKIEYSWSTQDNITIDRVPYIGSFSPGSQHLFVATGFGQWGMTTSMAAAMILTDMVQGKPNPWSDVFNPNRLRPDASAAKKLVTQNLKVIEKLAGGKLKSKVEISEIAPGEGKIAEVDQQTAAVYRDPQGLLYVLNPNCSHMGCTVAWNNAEKTWDCPCHGSRYNFSGEVIQGPAVKGLVPLRGTFQGITGPGAKIAGINDLSPGQMKGIENQGRQILLANVDGQYFAIGNTCTHKGCTLSEGKLEGYKLQCPCHGSIFNVKTGEVIQGPAANPEPAYKLKFEGEEILLVV